MQKIRKAVFPVAGFGTRFLPATKAMPKELLPIINKPLIQYAVEEAISAGIDTLIFITGRNKRAIEDHGGHLSLHDRVDNKRGAYVKFSLPMLSIDTTVDLKPGTELKNKSRNNNELVD